MTGQIFRDAPTVELLQWLARGSLKQNLARAVRLWVWLRSLYGEEKYRLDLPQSFTYADWRDAFFTTTHPKGEEIPAPHDRKCACGKTMAAWLFDKVTGIKQKPWRTTLEQHDSVLPNLDELLQQRLFGMTRRSLSADLQILADLGWLQRAEGQYSLVSQWPTRPIPESSTPSGNYAQLEALFQVLDLDKLMLLYPEIAPIADELYSDRYPSRRRVFFHLDYILSDETKDNVDDLQYQLQQLWQSSPVLPVLLTYSSAKLNKTLEYIVYPVCIYYVQRAKYLCAYGQTPAGKINWYNWRLDRIRKLDFLAWSDEKLPAELKQHYQKGTLPEPEYIQDQMSKAWGFDFYQPDALMLLRFDQIFHDRYISGTFRHDTFKQISYKKAGQLIERQAPELVEVWKMRSPQDAYYQAHYRKGDPNVEMRLRAWRPKMEVLLPIELRQTVAKEVDREWQFYRESH